MKVRPVVVWGIFIAPKVGSVFTARRGSMTLLAIRSGLRALSLVFGVWVRRSIFRGRAFSMGIMDEAASP